MSALEVLIISGVETGSMLDCGGSTAPSGYLLCNGDEVSRVTYARLFEVIGTTFGAGDGSTTFKLPDTRGRVIVGAGTGSGLSSRVLAATGGEEAHQVTESEMASHTHTQNSHSHGMKSLGNAQPGAYTGMMRGTNLGTPTVFSNTEVATATNQNTGGGQAHTNVMPSLVATKVIKF